MDSRALARIPVAPGPRGVHDLLAAMPGAFSGTPIAPVPVTSATVSDTYVSHLLQALRPELPLERDDISVVLATSGSTGRPRGVMLSGDALVASAQGAAAILGTPVEDSAWLVGIPVTSAGGFAIVVRSWLAGFAPQVLPSIGGAVPFRPADFVEATKSLSVRAAGRSMLTSLVPTQLSRLLEDPESAAALRDYTAILIGGARFDATLRSHAEVAEVRTVSTYGLTETAGGCVYDGRSFPGVELAVAHDGEVRIRGDVLALGYRLDPELTAARFVNEWLHTGDIGSLTDGRLSITGRCDDIVQIKGTNVSTEAVERCVDAISGVDACAVVAIPDVIDGHRLAAYVVSRGDSVARIRQAVADQLGPVAVPASITTVASLPILPNGKIDRAALAALSRRTRGNSR